MNDPEVRPEVVDLLMDSLEHGVTRTPEQQSLIATATGAEWHAVSQIMAAEFDGLWRRITGQATGEEEEFWARMPRGAIFDGLPGSAGFVLLAMHQWPWDEGKREMVRPVLAQWSPADRALLEERFGSLMDGGFHWDT